MKPLRLAAPVLLALSLPCAFAPRAAAEQYSGPLKDLPPGLAREIQQPWMRIQAPDAPPLPPLAASMAGTRAGAKLAADFSFLDSLRGGSPTKLHGEVFGAVDGKAYRTFIEDRVESISAFDCGGDANVPACGIHKHVFLTDNYGKMDLPQVTRVSILVHEARHAESEAGWPHVKCPEPFLDKNGDDILMPITKTPLAGKYACDTEALGAYGIGAIMLKNLGKGCSGCNGKVKLDASLFGDDSISRIIDPKAAQKLKEDLDR